MNNILNKILIEWDNSDIEDSGLIKVSDVENRMKTPQLVYKIDKPQKIKIFNPVSRSIYRKFKNKVYINDEHIKLRNGFTVNVYEPGEYRVYIEDFDKLEVIYYTTFSGCTGLTSVTLPKSLTSIGGNAFYGCSDLTSITIPDKVTSIGPNAFEDCTGLTSVNIGNSVTRIGSDAFYNCIGLTSVTIPNSVTSIGDWAFTGCTGLTSVTIPNSVTWIGSDAFYRCPNLKIIYVENINKFKKIKFLGHGDKTELLRNVKLIKLQK